MALRRLTEKQKHIVGISGLCLLTLLGIGLMAYPWLSSAYMNRVRSEILTEYQAQIASSNHEQLDEIRKSAITYNSQLSRGEMSLLEPEENGYFEQLVVPNTSNVMAYIHIPKIHVDLPIYHGVGTDSLNAGCGHMPQSSLPIGGESTHSVLSAHTGMANSAMFSDLPILAPGDIFQIEVLGEILTYEIQSPADIQTVLPVEVQAIQIKNGQDLCTLVTCVPFGINSHRLLVTGHRIQPPEIIQENLEDLPVIDEETDSVWLSEYKSALVMGTIIIVLMILGASCTVCYLSRKQGKFTK